GLPLFESIVAFETFPLDAAVQRATGEALGVAQAGGFDQTVYPLGLTVSPGASLTLTLKCDPRRYDRPAMGRLLALYEGILAAILVHGERQLAALPLLTAVE